MSKKSFKENNPALQFISLSQEAHDAQEASKEQDVSIVQEKQYVHPTQGKKGLKLPRINMAFSNGNLDYLHAISRLEGVSVTTYVNRLVEADKAIKSGIVEQAKNLLKGDIAND